MNSLRHSNTSGQALVEWVLILPLYLSLFVAIFAIGQRFLMRQQLIMAVRQAAFLYSSGRLQVSEVQQAVRQSLLKGFPPLDVPLENIHLGRLPGGTGTLLGLDQCTIDFQPRKILLPIFASNMEESCTIKHAPPYYNLLVFNWGPPVPW